MMSGSDVHMSNASPLPSPKVERRLLQQNPNSKPPSINNNSLLVNPNKYTSLTDEGGRLRKDVVLVRGKDFEIVPECIWQTLVTWYGGAPALPRTVINMSATGHQPDLELYPVCVRIMRHQSPAQRAPPNNPITGMVVGLGGMAWNFAANSNQPRRYQAHIASFSRKHTMGMLYQFLSARLRFYREDFRLWKINTKDDQLLTLLDDDNMTVEACGIEDNQQLLLEVRNKDLTWPEEMSQLAKNKTLKKDDVPTLKGTTGLNNLGNTCFMNAAVQCVSNTWALTQYFASGLHLFELNRTNPLGMKGHIAQRYGELVKDLWSGTSRTIAPLKLRWTISKYAPRFNGFQQHDSQELLSFLLDGLHEDLNRVHNKPYVELKDSDGRPDKEVAREAWENHLLRNQSIIVDMFHGQLKSQVRCNECGHVSVRFDPYSHLSLPLPMDSCIHLEVIVYKLDGSVPYKYGLRLNMEEKYRTLKQEVSKLAEIPEQELLIVEVHGPFVKSLPRDDQKIRNLLVPSLFLYQLPPPPLLPTLTAEEERGRTDLSALNGSASQESLDLVDMQRSTTPNSGPCTNSNNFNKSSSSTVTSSATTAASDSNHLQHLPQYPNTVIGSNNAGTTTTTTTSSSSSPPPPTTTTTSTNPSSTGNIVNSTTKSSLSPNHSRSPSNASSTQTSSSPDKAPDLFDNFVIGVHRKMNLMDMYFLSSQKSRPSLFGTPIIIPRSDKTTKQELYQFVWTQIARLVSPLPASESKTINHAQDWEPKTKRIKISQSCDDSLGYEYPFILKEVQKDGCMCARCPWYKFCRGCKVDCCNSPYENGSCFLAIDWEATALHLRYQTTQEKYHEEHASVAEARHKQTEPINLDKCLEAFTQWENLDEEDLYYCSKCKKHCLAAKKLDIWRLPPILIINLKRFQYMNGRWVKSHKIVNFPFDRFDPSAYLAKRCVPELTSDVQQEVVQESSLSKSSHIDSNQNKQHQDISTELPNSENENYEASTTSTTNPIRANGSVKSSTLTIDERLALFDKEDQTDARYFLYAMSCHTGILGGGHYVAYAKHQDHRWYCYNDSSCKEIEENAVDKNSAYILFYEREGVDLGHLLPDTTGLEPDLSEIEDEFDSELKRHCVLQ